MGNAKTPLSQTAKMDALVQSIRDEWDISKVTRVIKDVFAIDLKEISKKGVGKQAHLYDLEVKRAVAESLQVGLESDALEQHIREMEKIDLLAICLQQRDVTGPTIRKAVNQIFGVNLDGISSLENAGISIYSKGQWMIRKETDPIVVKTDSNDSSIEVYPTSPYQSNPALRLSMDRLRVSLTRLGFAYKEQLGVYEYRDPRGESISDLFKAELFSLLKGNIAQTFEGDI